MNNLGLLGGISSIFLLLVCGDTHGCCFSEISMCSLSNRLCSEECGKETGAMLFCLIFSFLASLKLLCASLKHRYFSRIPQACACNLTYRKIISELKFTIDLLSFDDMAF